MKNLKRKIEQKIKEAEEAKKFHWEDFKKNGFEEAKNLAREYNARVYAYKEVLELLNNN